MSSSSHSNGRGRRASIYTISGTAVLNAIKTKIKAADSAFLESDTLGCFFQFEEQYIKKKIRRYRRVYMPDHKYKVGWVVDADITFCMICLSAFGWFGLKHHCRACGLLVCGFCSPFTATVPYLLEEYGSRICETCHLIKPIVGEVDSLRVVASKTNDEDRPSIGSVGNRMVVSRTELSLSSLGEETEEQELIQKYEQAYMTMRQLIPLDIHKISFNTLLTAYHVPETVAMRLWTNKILWLIVMHPDDIAKIHLSDFRNTYVIGEDLDIVEMRAIWFNLPGWEEIPENDGQADVTPNSLYSVQVAKNKWRNGFKSRLDALNEKESRNTLSVEYIRNEAYLSHPDLVLFDPDAPLSSGLDLTGIYHQQSSALREYDNSQYSGITSSSSHNNHSNSVGFDIENAEDDEEEEYENTLRYQQQVASTLKQMTSPDGKSKSRKTTSAKQITLNDSELVNDAHIEAHLIPFIDDEEEEEVEKEGELNNSLQDLERRSFEELNRKKLLNKNTSRVLTQFYKLEQESSKSFRVQQSAQDNTEQTQDADVTYTAVISSSGGGGSGGGVLHVLPTIVSDDGSSSSLSEDSTPHSQQQQQAVNLSTPLKSTQPQTPQQMTPQAVTTPLQSTTQYETSLQTPPSQTPPVPAVSVEVVKHMVPVARRRSTSGHKH